MASCITPNESSRLTLLCVRNVKWCETVIVSSSNVEIEVTSLRLAKELRKKERGLEESYDTMVHVTREGQKLKCLQSLLHSLHNINEKVHYVRSFYMWWHNMLDERSTLGVVALADQAAARASREVTEQAAHEIHNACQLVAEHTSAQAAEENLVVLHRQRVRMGCLMTAAIFRKHMWVRMGSAFVWWGGITRGLAVYDRIRRLDELDHMSRVADLYRVRDHQVSAELETADRETRLALLLQYKHNYLSKPFLIWKDMVLLNLAMAQVEGATERRTLVESGALTMATLTTPALTARPFYRWKQRVELQQEGHVRDELKEEELEARYHQALSEQRAHIDILEAELKKYDGLIDAKRLGARGCAKLLREMRAASGDIEEGEAMGRWVNIGFCKIPLAD